MPRIVIYSRESFELDPHNVQESKWLNDLLNILRKDYPNCRLLSVSRLPVEDRINYYIEI